jgi:hypothetical protein
MNTRERYIEATMAEWDRCTRDLRGLPPERRREKGELCASCDAEMSRPQAPGYRQCPHCQPAGVYAVYMRIRYTRGAWHCSFLEEGREEKLLRELTFVRPNKLRETAKRGKGMTSAAGKRRVNSALGSCSGGGVWLQLTGEQYLKLRRQPDAQLRG